jgi:hypothetical protein
VLISGSQHRLISESALAAREKSLSLKMPAETEQRQSHSQRRSNESFGQPTATTWVDYQTEESAALIGGLTHRARRGG